MILQIQESFLFDTSNEELKVYKDLLQKENLINTNFSVENE